MSPLSPNKLPVPSCRLLAAKVVLAIVACRLGDLAALLLATLEFVPVVGVNAKEYVDDEVGPGNKLVLVKGSLLLSVSALVSNKPQKL